MISYFGGFALTTLQLMRQHALVQANVRSDNALASAQVDSSPRPCLRVPPPRCCTPLARLLCAAQRTNVSTGGRTWGTRPLVVSSQLVCRPPLACAGAQSTGPDSTCCCSSTVVMRTHAYAHAHHLRPRYLLAGTDGVERVQHRLPSIQAQVSRVRTPMHACMPLCRRAPANASTRQQEGLGQGRTAGKPGHRDARKHLPTFFQRQSDAASTPRP